MLSRDTTYLDAPEGDECDCSLCKTGIGDGYGHDDGPKPESDLDEDFCSCRCHWEVEDYRIEALNLAGEDV